jgi:antitoxin (DNA-binding transcriptional repressor) of toxin-antitoxin stability system
MTTLSVTQARVNLSSLLKRAAHGEDIGILCGDQIIALRPVAVTSNDYALREYGISEVELKKFAQRLHEETKRERKAGTIKPYTGNLEADLRD